MKRLNSEQEQNLPPAKKSVYNPNQSLPNQNFAPIVSFYDGGDFHLVEPNGGIVQPEVKQTEPFLVCMPEGARFKDPAGCLCYLSWQTIEKTNLLAVPKPIDNIVETYPKRTRIKITKPYPIRIVKQVGYYRLDPNGSDLHFHRVEDNGLDVTYWPY